MSKHALAECINEPFIERLAEQYKWVKQNHVARLLIGLRAHSDARFFDDAFKFNPREMEQVLLNLTFDPDNTLEARASAARCLLHGAEQGFWKIKSNKAEKARALVIAHFGKPMEDFTMEKTKADLAREAGLPTEDFTITVKPVKSRAERRRARQAKLAHIVAVCRACAELEYAFKTGTNDEKLDAFERYFQTMHRLASEELRKQFPNARKLN
jgi:hypothetical protein